MEFELGKKYVGSKGDYEVTLYPTVVSKGRGSSSWNCAYWYVEVKAGVQHRRHGKPVGIAGVERHLTADGYDSSDLVWRSEECEIYNMSPWKMFDNREDCVYFLHAIGTDRVKIGWAAILGSRINTIAAGCPFPLRVLGTTPGRAEVESILHQRFSHLRVHNEWFLLTREIVSFIQAECDDSVL